MRSARRVFLPLAVLLSGVLAALAPTGGERGGGPAARAEDDPVDRMKPGHCGCGAGRACWHYLRTPLRPPEDPCRCGLCAAKGNCSTKERPDGWSGACMGSQDVECFWKRHAASWGIACSECFADRECPACDEVLRLPNPEVLATLRRQVAQEGGAGKRKLVVAYSPRFYVATDIPRLKLFTQDGAPRVVDTHEIAHLFVERSEKAYDDFVKAFGDEVRLGKPMAVYLANRRDTKEGWQSAYFGHSRTNMLYGGSDTNSVAGGFCWNGFALSAEELHTDRDLHATVRHMIGHILFSCWHGVAPFQKNCPKWAFCGVADWLCKSDPLFFDHVTFCQDEGPVASGSGKDWDKKARVIAGTRHAPIEKLFGIPSLSHMSYDDLVRSWSYMDLMLKEDRARWLVTLKAIREGDEHAVAFRKGLGITPDEFDRRWVDRMTGARKSMGADPRRDVVDDEDGPGAAERRRIRSEQDPTVLAALLRGLEKVADVKTAALVVGKFSPDSDLIRETLVLLLSKTDAPEVVAWLREKGLADPDPLVRAGVARVLGAVKDGAARPTLEALLGDAHFLCRAYAAQALQAIADPASLPALLANVEDANPKAWIAKADALAVHGAAASKATLPVVARLTASDWQVRLTACRALAAVGNADAVEPLIDRLDAEGGRLKREILAALRAVSRESFGENPQTWRNWWKMQKPRGIPPEAPRPVEDDRYARPKRPGEPDPTYYGRRIFSQSVLFVLDVSKSMDSYIKIPPDAMAKLGGRLTPGPRIQVAKSAISQAIEGLDPRTRFNVVFFSTLVKPWKDGLVVAAQPTKDAAISAIQGAPLEDETNVYGALRAAVGLHEKPTMSAQLDPIPDTIYFLTDGTPTRGEITDGETILSWMRDVNRFAKVDLHVVAMGNLGVDLTFLSRLAAENGGEFIHVPEGS
jgi:hypothetical protein